MKNIEFSNFQLTSEQLDEVSQYCFTRWQDHPDNIPEPLQRSIIKHNLEQSVNNTGTNLSRLYNGSGVSVFTDRYLMEAVVDGWLEAHGMVKVAMFGELSKTLEEIQNEIDTIDSFDSIAGRGKFLLGGKQSQKELFKRLKVVATEKIKLLGVLELRIRAIQEQHDSLVADLQKQ